MGQVTRYSESEQAWNKSEQNRITELQLARGFQVADASWPLYAAMPAILKQAVVDSYTRCGWDVQNSIQTIRNSVMRENWRKRIYDIWWT